MAPLSQKIYYAGQRAERVVFWNQYEDALNRAWQVYGDRRKLSSGLSALKPAGGA